MITYCHFHGAVETNHTTMYAAIATNVTLKCNIEPNVIANTYRWRREDNSPLISGKRVGNVNHYIMRNQNNTILSLVITNVKKKRTLGHTYVTGRHIRVLNSRKLN